VQHVGHRTSDDIAKLNKQLDERKKEIKALQLWIESFKKTLMEIRKVSGHLRRWSETPIIRRRPRFLRRLVNTSG